MFVVVFYNNTVVGRWDSHPEDRRDKLGNAPVCVVTITVIAVLIMLLSTDDSVIVFLIHILNIDRALFCIFFVFLTRLSKLRSG